MKVLLVRSVLALGLIMTSRMGAARVAAQELPKAEDILDREEQAVGGKEANHNVKTVMMKGKLSIMQMQLGVTVYHAGPGKHYKETAAEGIGHKAVVVLGNLAWKTDSITGSRLLKGEEKDKALNDALAFAEIFRRVGNWRQKFKGVKTLAEENVEGKPAYKVQMISMQGPTWIDHYDKESGLLVRREMTVETPQGKMPFIQHFGDYRKIDGIAHAFTTRLVTGPTEVVVTLTEMRHNISVPEALFALPATLKKQLENSTVGRR